MIYCPHCHQPLYPNGDSKQLIQEEEIRTIVNNMLRVDDPSVVSMFIVLLTKYSREKVYRFVLQLAKFQMVEVLASVTYFLQKSMHHTHSLQYLLTMIQSTHNKRIGEERNLQKLPKEF